MTFVDVVSEKTLNRTLPAEALLRRPHLRLFDIAEVSLSREIESAVSICTIGDDHNFVFDCPERLGRTPTYLAGSSKVRPKMGAQGFRLF